MSALLQVLSDTANMTNDELQRFQAQEMDLVQFRLCNMQFAGNTVHCTLYHGLATFTEVTFVNVHHAQMSTLVIEVCLCYIGFVIVFNSSLHY